MTKYKKMLEEAGVIKKGHFKLTSGRHSDTYINKDGIYCNPELFERTAFLLEREVGDGYNGIAAVDVITGPALAGAILAAPIALRTGKIFVYPEKVPEITWPVGVPHEMAYPIIKTTMQLRRGFPEVVKGKRVLLIEDIITTGKSVRETAECIQKAGGEIVEIRCIWNRSGVPFLGMGLSQKSNAPILSISNDPVESWEPEECPLCRGSKCSNLAECTKDAPTPKQCLSCQYGSLINPLTDPKTGEVI